MAVGAFVKSTESCEAIIQSRKTYVFLAYLIGGLEASHAANTTAAHTAGELLVEAAEDVLGVLMILCTTGTTTTPILPTTAVIIAALLFVAESFVRLGNLRKLLGGIRIAAIRIRVMLLG